jgi:class 3 adenylate cyclase
VLEALGYVPCVAADTVMAAFGLPRVAEDDALRAVRAALAMQQAFRALAQEQSGLGLRVAVNTGEVVTEQVLEVGCELDDYSICCASDVGMTSIQITPLLMNSFACSGFTVTA